MVAIILHLDSIWTLALVPTQMKGFFVMDQATKEVILEAFALAIKSIEGQMARAKVEAVRKAFQSEIDKFQGAKQAFLTFATKTK